MNDEDLIRLKEKLYGDSSQLHRYRSPDSLRSVMDLSQFVGDMIPCRQRNIETQALLYAAIEQWYFCRGAVTTFRRLARRARTIYRLRGESIRQVRRPGSPVTLPEQTPMSDGLSESFHPVRRGVDPWDMSDPRWKKVKRFTPENQTSEMLSNKSLIRVNPMLGISFELAERLSSPSALGSTLLYLGMQSGKFGRSDLNEFLIKRVYPTRVVNEYFEPRKGSRRDH